MTGQPSDPVPAPASPARPASLPLSQLRLLVVLDALLRAGSVSGAAEELQISVPAASRLLAQLRALYGDPILVRSGRRMVPTALAASLRRRVGALSDDARALLSARQTAPADPVNAAPGAVSTLLPGPERPRLPLRWTEHPGVEGEPGPDTILHRHDTVSADDPPRTRLAAHVSRIAGGARQGGLLTFDQSRDAFGIVLDGEADPVQIGALLAGIQQRGIVAPELGGLVAAARARLPRTGRDPALRRGNAPCLDWPAYRSPRQNRPPWYLAAARLLADAGIPVALHGFATPPGPVREVMQCLRIVEVDTLPRAVDTLDTAGIVYLRIEGVAPQLAGLNSLYAVLAMRTIAQIGLRLLDPLQTGRTLCGVPFASGGSLMSAGFALQQEGRLLSVLSHRDVAQATPHRWMQLALAESSGETLHSVAPHVPGAAEGLPGGYAPADMLAALWQGRAREAGILATILDTAALGLFLIHPDTGFDEAQRQAAALWAERRPL